MNKQWTTNKKKALCEELKAKALRRENYYNSRLKELGLTEEQFAEADLLRQQFDEEFDLLKKPKG